MGIERYTQSFTDGCTPYLDAYKTWYLTVDNCQSVWVQSSVTQGKFRIARTGTTISAYYWNGTSWVVTRTESTSSGPVGVEMYRGSDDSQSQQVRMDNLIITSTAPTNSDGDTIPDCRDNCPALANSDQVDTDADTFGDSCDNCPIVVNALQEDTDGDTVGDSCDICLTFFNPLQQPILAGDVDGSGGRNLVDIIFLVNYVYKFGPAPSPLCRGDQNGSGGFPNITDILRLINFVYKAGPPPVKIGVCCL